MEEAVCIPLGGNDTLTNSENGVELSSVLPSLKLFHSKIVLLIFFSKASSLNVAQNRLLGQDVVL